MPVDKKIEISGLTKTVAIIPLIEIFPMVKAIIGKVKKVAPRDALMLSFKISGRYGFKK